MNISLIVGLIVGGIAVYVYHTAHRAPRGGVAMNGPSLLVVQIDCQDCALDGAERQMLGPTGRCHRCGSGSFVFVGSGGGATRYQVADGLASIVRAEADRETAHAKALADLRSACGLEPAGGAR